MNIVDSDHVQVTIDLSEAHAVSVGLGAVLDQNDIEVGTGIVACFMLISRLMSPDEQDELDEVNFLKAAMEWSQAYFMEGHN